jgi:hypothetical protein
MSTIRPADFRSASLPFETVDTPSDKRDNPAVLGITDAQVDLVRAPVKAYEVRVTAEGKIEIGLLKNVKLSKADVDAIRGAIQNPSERRIGRSGGYGQPPVAPPPAVPPAPAPPIPAAPAAPGGGRGRGGEGRGQMPNAGPTDDGRRTEKLIIYVPLEDLDKELQKQPDATPALSVYPVRMIVVQAAFPLKEQLEVIRRALRLKTIAEAEQESRPTSGSGQGPTFTGFEVERRIIAPNGQEYDWAPYDHISQYISKINIRKFADQPDDGYLTYFLRYDQRMAMPLPALAANLGVYPGVRLPAIVAGYKKLVDAGKKPEDPSALKKKFEGQDNPFMPSTDTGTGFGGAAPSTGISPGRGEERIGKGDRPMAAPPGAPGSPVLPASMAELEHMLIRFLDVDVRPGFTYQYRVRVKMKNPNFGSKLVARPDDAKQLELFGPWVAIANQVNVPMDHNMYAGDPIAYAEKIRKDFKDPKVINLLDNKNGEVPVIQFQAWTERIPIDSGRSEPAGYWVVAEVPVNRGEYVGRKQLVTLPMWSSEKVAFILQELPKYSVRGANEKPKGLLVDFTSDTLMVDYEGGKSRAKVGERIVEDEADVEVMMLKPDGTVIVRNSGRDREEIERKAREEAWRKWLDEIRAQTEKLGQPGGSTGSGNPLFP